MKLAKNAPLAVEFPDPEKGGDFIKSSYQAEVAGDWKRVLEFIHRLQSPTEFRYTKNLTLTTRKSEAQDGAAELVCNFVLQKWWHPDSQTLLDEQAAAKELAGTPPPVPAPAPSVPAAPAAEEPESPAPSEASPAVAPVAPPSPQ